MEPVPRAGLCAIEVDHEGAAARRPQEHLSSRRNRQAWLHLHIRRQAGDGSRNGRGGLSMRYLVTGTSGFIGFHLAKRLLDDGHFVVGFDGMTPYYDLKLKEKRTAILARSNGFKSITGMLEDRA